MFQLRQGLYQPVLTDLVTMCLTSVSKHPCEMQMYSCQQQVCFYVLNP